METKFLLMWLEAPLQSWGADSKFNRRDTVKFPTKSGITGLILSALGASGEQVELLLKLAPLKLTVISFVRSRQTEDSRRIKIAPEPLLRDFHMVGSGYNDSDPWTTMLIPKKSDGTKAVGGGTKLTYRYYLQDARFATIVEIPSELSTTFSEALKCPVYDLFLGRKNCVPTDFIFRGVFDTENDAYQKSVEIALEKNLCQEFRVIDGESEEGDVITLNDVPLQFGEFKKYKDRRVTVIYE
jgi:CRISPR system Cascade subunit CasD